MRLKTYIKPKEATLQVVLDALALTPFYQAFLITAEVPAIYMQEFWVTVFVHKSSIIFMINKKKVSLDVDIAFDTIINKCLSGKETGMDKIRLSHIYAFASGEKTPKPKYVRKKADSDTSPEQKPVQATKGTRLKSKAKVAKPDKKKQPAKKPKAKELAVLSEVALTEDEQLKLATKRSKTQFHSSHGSGSGDGVDTQSKVPDEQQQKTFGTDEGTGTIPGIPNVPIYESESEKESWGDSEDEDNENDSNDLSDEGDDNNDGNDGDDDDANDDDKKERDDMNDDDEETDSDRTESDRIKIPILDQSKTEYYEAEENINDEETMYDDEDDEVTKELYEDMNVNLENKDTEMTNADQGALEQQNVSQESGFEQIEEDAHVTLSPVLDTQKADEPVQSSSISSDFTSKLLNLKNPSPADNEIASLMETLAQKNVTESVEDAVLTWSSSQPTSTYEAAASLSEFKVTKILIDKMEKNKSYDKADYKKKLYDELVESYNTDKDLFDSYGESAHTKEPIHTVEDSGMQQDQEFVMVNNEEQPDDKEDTKADWFKKPERPPTLDPDWKGDDTNDYNKETDSDRTDVDRSDSILDQSTTGYYERRRKD
ncbi:hypothetical protein Tco_1215942 [Tanacetum coccineum]